MIRLKNKTYIWAILTLTMVLIALFFGLRPKAWSSANDVQRLADLKALRFQNAGIAYVDDLRVAWPDQPPYAWTIEMVVAPGSIRKKGFSPLLMMHDGSDRRQLAIWQYGPSLIAMNGDDYAYRRREPRITANNIFSDQQIRYLTITSSDRGTHLFVDGELAVANENWKMSIPNTGNPLRLVLGNSVYAKRGWKGDLYGLAISGEAISAAAARLRFDRWAAGRRFDFMKPDSSMLFFTFDQETVNRLADQSQGHILHIPEKMIALEKTFLSMPGKHLNWNRDAVVDIVLNVAGFIPLGAVCYGFLSCFSGPVSRHKFLATVIFCMALSLGIEFSQAWIPTRVSSLLDLILNTGGAWIGVIVVNMHMNWLAAGQRTRITKD